MRPSLSQLITIADTNGIDVSDNVAAIQRTIAAMKAKLGVPAHRPLRVN